jgi:hypothetical protein
MEDCFDLPVAKPPKIHFAWPSIEIRWWQCGTWHKRDDKVPIC